MAKTSGLMTTVLSMSTVVALVQLFSGGVYSVQGMGPIASPPASECLEIFANNLMDCLDYVTPGNYSTVPPVSCCTGLANIVKTQPICLCQFLGNRSEIEGFPINGTKSVGLPAVCKVSTPPHSMCPKVVYGSPASTLTMSHKGNMAPSPSHSPHYPYGPGAAPGPMPTSDSVRLRSAVGVVLAVAELLLLAFDYSA